MEQMATWRHGDMRTITWGHENLREHWHEDSRTSGNTDSVDGGRQPPTTGLWARSWHRWPYYFSGLRKVISLTRLYPSNTVREYLTYLVLTTHGLVVTFTIYIVVHGIRLLLSKAIVVCSVLLEGKKSLLIKAGSLSGLLVGNLVV